MNRSVLLLVAALLACALAVAAAEDDGVILITALSWVAVAVGFVVAALIIERTTS